MFGDKIDVNIFFWGKFDTSLIFYLRVDLKYDGVEPVLLFKKKVILNYFFIFLYYFNVLIFKNKKCI
jgi:hypothetical protein